MTGIHENLNAGSIRISLLPASTYLMTEEKNYYKHRQERQEQLDNGATLDFLRRNESNS